MNLFKFKNFVTDEGIIIRCNEALTLLGGITRTLTATGHLERVYTEESYAKADTLGTITVLWNNLEFEVAPGRNFTLADKKAIWEVWKKHPEVYVVEPL
jgi:hypothetical protein